MALSLSAIIDVLPQLLALLQILVYVSFSWVFGSFAFFGMRKRIPFAIKIPAKLGVGFLCLLAGAAIRGFFPVLEGSVFRMFLLDLLAGGAAASALVGVALFLITRGEEDGKKTIGKLEERVGLLEGFLLKQKAPVLSEDEVKKKAESLLPGFSAKQANLRDADWEIILDKGGRQAAVVLGAYTGDVRQIDRGGGRLRDPYLVSGAAIMIAVLVFTVITFRGLPSITEGMASLLGMNDEQFRSLTGGNVLPEGCVATVRILMSQGVNVVSSGNDYTNDPLKATIESSTGRQVLMMYKTEFEGGDYVISITLPQGMSAENVSNDDMMRNADICTSTFDTLCDCVKIPELNNMPTGFIVAASK